MNPPTSLPDPGSVPAQGPHVTSDADSVDALRALLGPEGPVAAAFRAQGRGYEERPQQTEMAIAVSSVLSSGRHLVVEAGTGVGKSFAYLVPLLAWAAERSATVAVATSTIALQEQLVRQDLPLLKAALPFEVSYALVKGRGNYLCLRRMHRAVQTTGQLFETGDREAQLQAIRDWAGHTADGSRQDVPFKPDGAVWDHVRAERGNCKGRACTFYGRCFYQRSRRQAHSVRLLVLNHHVLMSDLALKRGGASFLPKVDALVVDEAHDLEGTAAEHLGLRFSSLGASQLLGRLWNPERSKGLLATEQDGPLRREVERARAVGRNFFGELGAWLEGKAHAGDVVAIPDGLPVDDALSARLRDLAEGLGRSTRRFADEDVAMELTARAQQLRAAAETLEGLREGRPGEVRWMERGRYGSVALASAPVDVGPLLGDVLWDPHHSVTLTSATLATGRPPSFTFLRERLGMEDADELSVGSPFDYPRQARIVIRRDVPDPVSAAQAYESALAGAVRDAVRATDGGAFVLFTGYGAMRRTVEAIGADLETDGLEVLVQGQGLERPALLERFRQGGAVLFGVASFWQGVDVPGEALRHVVIARLPFEVPTHPLQQARYARLEEQGRSPFSHLALPVAALRLKQGFGRLIRSSSDTGRVTILDSRIVTRTYGRYLLKSLPDCPVEIVETG